VDALERLIGFYQGLKERDSLKLAG